MILAIDRLSFSYDQTPLLSELSFTVSPGEVVCLLGPNGSGKSTLLDCVLGFHRNYQGAIKLCGREARGLSRLESAKCVSYVPQLHAPTFPYTVREVVLMGRTAQAGLFGAPKEKDFAICDDALRRIGIAAFADRPYTELSGGERKMVLLARALAQQAPLIALDEPTSSLDFKNELQFLETLSDLAAENGVAVLMATHALSHPLYFESQGLPVKVVLLCKNRPARIGTPTALITPQTLLEVYGVHAAVQEIKTEDGKTVKSVAVLGSMEE